MQKSNEPATDPRVGAGEPIIAGQLATEIYDYCVSVRWGSTKAMMAERDIKGIIAPRITALEAQLASAQRQHERFARDIALKLGIEYAPPVAKGMCEYLVALENMKAQLADANTRIKQWEAQAKRADVALADLEGENERMRGALETIAKWPFDIRGDCVADARKLAQDALEAPASAREGGGE